jgi:glyoxylase I family protein
MSPARALHHLALGAADVERVAAFYRDVLGLPEQKRNQDDSGNLRSIWLDLGAGATLMVERTHQPDPSARRVDGIAAGLFLLCVRISPEDRAETEARLEASGGAIEQRTAFTSYARDPEGNRVAVSFHPLMSPP